MRMSNSATPGRAIEDLRLHIVPRPPGPDSERRGNLCGQAPLYPAEIVIVQTP
jgi:hypothetical protein